MSAAVGAPTFYVNNPVANSVDWTNAVTGLAGVINSNVNLTTHPVGPLVNNHYTASDGVTFSTVGNFGGVEFGAGPEQANTGGAPGEGPHAASNYLRTHSGIDGQNTTTTISFAQSVLGAGLMTIDFFDSGTPMTLEAFSGPDGTGAMLGSAVAVEQNFQQNRQYFMGVVDPAGIGSIRLIHGGQSLSDVIGIDDIVFARVPEPHTIGLAGLCMLGVVGRRLRRR
jgi:hypothetical protein